MNRRLYYTGTAAMRLLLRLLTRWKVEGRENVPKSGPIIIISNHLHIVDPPLLGASLDRHIAFMAKEELTRIPLLGWAIRALGSFTVRRGEADLKALKQALRHLEAGDAIGIFPEGTRQRSATMARALPGSAFIAIKAGAPIVPVAITGTEQLRNPLGVLRRPRITVRFGEPFLASDLPSAGPRPDLPRVATEMMMRVAALAPESYRGVYRQRLEEAEAQSRTSPS